MLLSVEAQVVIVVPDLVAVHAQHFFNHFHMHVTQSTALVARNLTLGVETVTNRRWDQFIFIV